MNREPTVYGYMCATDFAVELLHGTPDGKPIYSTFAELKRKSHCWKGCGVVRVALTVEAIELEGCGTSDYEEMAEAAQQTREGSEP